MSKRWEAHNSLFCCRRTRSSTRQSTQLPTLDAEGLEDDLSEGGENADLSNTPRVGDKRTKSGSVAKRTTRGSSKATQESAPELTEELESQLFQAVSDMLVDQRYVDEWKVEGVVRWLKENKDMNVSQDVLEEYFDRVDQNLPSQVPHVLYDVAEKTVHRDY
jgi:hypothetical protein